MLDRTEYNLDMAAKNMNNAMFCLTQAADYISMAFDRFEPDYPAPDSLDARAIDYQDAISAAMREVGFRLNTWDGGDYFEG
jgi:hypothetical protein